MSSDRACREFRALQTSRRAVVQAGVASMLGLGLPALLQHQALASSATSDNRQLPGFGKAKRCIFLFMWGGPSQLDTFDMKPNAPDNIRGPFKPISTKVPGLQMSEHFQQLAGVMDKVAVIRSLSHDDPAHLSSGHTTVTGHLAPVVRSDATPPSSRDTPHIGSVLAKLKPQRIEQKTGRAGSLTYGNGMPPFVMVPWKVFHPSAPGGTAPGQHGGWLGPEYDAMLATGDPNNKLWKLPALQLQNGVTPESLQSRYQLLQQIDEQRAAFEQLQRPAAMSAHQSKALELLASPKVREAFEISKEPNETRERYGRNIHGQSVLLGRRLLEHGVPIVNINWHNDGKNFWDTHGNNFNRLKDDLIPPADRALTALLTDLSERGMLEDTLVAWVGEFGRNPNIANGTGREHWPYCYSGLLAGAGIAGGAVYGTSDKHAAYPATSPVTPHDYAATMLHALGIPADAKLHDRDGRPHAVYAGQPIVDLFA
jgi:hypothetical protein